MRKLLRNSSRTGCLLFLENESLLEWKATIAAHSQNQTDGILFMSLNNSLRNRSGFTLVELLVVIAIIGILVGLLLPAVQAAREAARRMQCSNNMRQLGIAVHNYESAYKRLPSGWVDNYRSGEPGWGWAAGLLPFMEGGNIHNQIDFRIAIEEEIHHEVREVVVNTFLCPSDPGETIFRIGAGGDHDHDHGHDHRSFNRLDEDADEHLFDISRSNYVAMFGTFELEDAPYRGNGMFYGNSKTKFADVTDGLSNTLMIGERGSRLGYSIWHGNIPEAAEPHARVTVALTIILSATFPLACLCLKDADRANEVELRTADVDIGAILREMQQKPFRLEKCVAI